MGYYRWFLSGLVWLAVLAAPGLAHARELLSADLTAGRAAERDCIAGPAATGAPGQTQRTVTAPATGWVSARLEAASGDWDVAIFDAATGRRVAGSAQLGPQEVAEGIAEAGQSLTVQACRRSGSAQRADLSVHASSIENVTPEQLSLVRVSTPNAARKRELVDLGLDLTEHGGPGFVEVVLHGADDARKLREGKFIYVMEVADLAQASARRAAADTRTRRTLSASDLPSGRVTYRRLDDYSNEMKALAAANPDLVKPLVLPHQTLGGRNVEGIEITTDVNARDGKPVFLQMGAHHAREWPSSEHAMEWAYELVAGYRAGDERIRRLVSSTRTIVVPIVNPDGFNTSREAGEAGGAAGGRGGNETANLLIPYEYQRKNCRVTIPEQPDPEQANCMQQPATGFQQFGVDPNRNYGGFWGGPGAAPPNGTPPGEYAQDYRGEAPFSERETQNIRALVSQRHVTTLITNHTFSNLVLRPPGIQSQGPTVDEPVYKALGDAMAGENGYSSQFSYQLYDTTGGTEDWTYYATGGLGFTFEIGPSNFHPPFAQMVAEYEGTTPVADAQRDGGGNRAAYFIAQENAADASRHSVVEGSAPAGTVLRLKKSFKTATSPVLDAEGNEGEPILFDDTLDTTMVVPRSGRFEWHVNPSTRPVVAQSYGRPANGQPSPPVQESGGTGPSCPTYFDDPATCPPGSVEDRDFTIPPNGGGVDNGFATVRLDWATAASDYDLEIYRDANNDGDLDDDGEGTPTASSAQGQTNEEETTLGPDPAPGRYVARVIRYLATEPYEFSVTFEGPEPFRPAQKESWTLTCEFPEGRVQTTQQVQIDRGQRQSFDLSACASAAQAPRGGSQTSGDFDGDGRTDLAIGSPGENRGSGAVTVLYGSDNGLRSDRTRQFTQRSPGVEGADERGDAFGAALAAGDHDGDGTDDLSIGIPGEDVGRRASAGAVTVLYGSSGEGLRGQGSRLLHQGLDTVEGGSERRDSFGYALGSFDLSGDGRADLVAGAPGESVGKRAAAGAVNVLQGAAGGGFAPGGQLLVQGGGLPGKAERNDRFGSSFASADFDRDGLRDLAAGAPGEAVKRARGAGAVSVVAGARDRLGGGRVVHQGDGRTAGKAERRDRFGLTLALGDLDGDGRPDLAVGAPGEDVGAGNGAGSVNVLFGAGSLGERNAVVDQSRRDVADAPERGDAFGSALAAGDLDGDGLDDLGIGARGETMRRSRRAGAANVVYGARDGLGAGGVLWSQNTRGVEGAAEAGDVLAGSLGIADTTGAGPADLTLGVPGEDLGRRRDAGVVHLLPGHAGGVTANGSRLFDQGVAERVERRDRFGAGR